MLASPVRSARVRRVWRAACAGWLIARIGLAQPQLAPAASPAATPPAATCFALEFGLGPPLLGVAGTDDAAHHAAVAAYRAPAFDAREWARIARDAGAADLGFCVKDRDGFCLFRSAATDFDILATAHERDLLRDLARACREEHLPLGFVYSLADAQHGGRADYADLMGRQLHELCEGYQPAWLALCGTVAAGSTVDALMRVLPVDLARTWRDRHATTLASPEYASVAWTPNAAAAAELCYPLRVAEGYRSTSHLLRALFTARSSGARLRVTIEADAAGSLPGEAVRRLGEVGRWLRTNGDALAATPLEAPLPVAATARGNLLFLLPAEGAECTVDLPVAVRDARWHRGRPIPWRPRAGGVLLQCEASDAANPLPLVELELASPLPAQARRR